MFLRLEKRLAYFRMREAHTEERGQINAFDPEFIECLVWLSVARNLDLS